MNGQILSVKINKYLYIGTGEQNSLVPSSLSRSQAKRAAEKKGPKAKEKNTAQVKATTVTPLPCGDRRRRRRRSPLRAAVAYLDIQRRRSIWTKTRRAPENTRRLVSASAWIQVGCTASWAPPPLWIHGCPAFCFFKKKSRIR